MENLDYQKQNTAQVLPDDHKALAITSLVLSVLCCNIISIVFAILSLVKSLDVSKLFVMGQTELATRASKNAKIFGWVAIGLLVAGLVINLVYFFALGGMEAYMEMLEQMK